MKCIHLMILLLFIFSCSDKSGENNEPSKKAEKNVKGLSPDGKFKNNKTGYDTTFYKNGEKKLAGMLLGGKRNGIWVSWYPNGVKWSEGEFKDGVYNGKTVTYYETGSKRYEGYYMDGKRAGKWFFWDENGKLTNELDYTNNEEKRP